MRRRLRGAAQFELDGSHGCRNLPRRPVPGVAAMTLHVVPDTQPAPRPIPVGAALRDAGVPLEWVAPATEAFQTWLAQKRDEVRGHYPIHTGAVDEQTESARGIAVELENQNA